MRVERAPIDRSAAILGFAVVAAAGIRYLAGLSKILDPVVSMEPFYIDLAQRSVSEILSQNPAWGPLYALWLKPFRTLLADPLRVYAANVYFLSFGLSVAVYCYTLLLTRRAAVATGAALFLLISDLNVPLSSKVFVFTLIMVLVGLALSELAARDERRMAIGAAGVLVGSYARPELYPAGLCLWILAIWLARPELRKLHLPTLGWVVGGTGLLLFVAWWIGTPLWDPEENRLFQAFREHFAWNWSRWNGGSEYYLAIWQREFGTADGIVRACLENPGAFAHHVLDNLKGVLESLFGSTFDHFPLFAVSTWPWLVRTEDLAVAAAAFGCIIRVAASRELRRDTWQRYRQIFLILPVLTIFPIAGATLVYPRTHYLLVPSVCIILVGTLAVSILLPPMQVRSPFRRALIALLAVTAIPTPFVLPTDHLAAGIAPVGNLAVTRTVTDTVELIRSLDLPEPVHVLTFTDGIGELLGDGFHEVKIWRRGERPLKSYLEDEHVDVIVTTEQGRRSFLVDDPYWETIQLDPATTGFAPVATASDTVARIWVRAGLLEKSGSEKQRSQSAQERSG